jgi:integrase
MAINILKAEQVKSLTYSNEEKNKNSLNDGGGLRIAVKKDNTKVWKFIYTLNGIRKDTSFGTFPKVTLAGARIKAKEFRDLIENNIDPLEDRKKKKELAKAKNEEKKHLIEIIANDYLDLEKYNKNLADITINKTKERLVNHFYPYLKAKEKTVIHNISFEDIVKALQVLENDNKFETLSRIKRVIVNIFEFAYTENIIKDTEIYGKLKIKKFKIQTTTEQNPTLTKKEDIRSFYSSILNYKYGLITKYALLLTLHTAQRQGTIIKAKWENIHFDTKLWKIPKEDMKNKKEHHLPLSTEMIDYLKELYLITGAEKYLFPNQQPKHKNTKKHMSENTVNVAIRKMGFTREQQTAHGIRAMFKTICKENQEKYNLNNEFVEMVLAHKTAGAVENTYNRARNIDDMRVIVEWWSNYILSLKNEVK